MSSTAPRPVDASAADLSLTYEQTIAAMKVVQRIPGQPFDLSLELLIRPVWETLDAHLKLKASSREQYYVDRDSILRLRPKKADTALFELPFLESVKVNQRNAVEEAVSIVRTLDVTEIDWSKEPASDYERRIRVEYLIDAGVLGLLRLQLATDKPASDLQKALDVLPGETKKARAEKERQRIQDIREKLNRQGASENGV